jgi:hypothetical protein
MLKNGPAQADSESCKPVISDSDSYKPVIADSDFCKSVMYTSLWGFEELESVQASPLSSMYVCS